MERKEINSIRVYIEESRFRITDHALEEMRAENFDLEDVVSGIMNGEIIEDYLKAYPLPACLINGKTNKNRSIHICISLPPLVKIITVYEPSFEKWQDDFKRRKA